MQLQVQGFQSWGLPSCIRDTEHIQLYVSVEVNGRHSVWLWCCGCKSNPCLLSTCWRRDPNSGDVGHCLECQKTLSLLWVEACQCLCLVGIEYVCALWWAWCSLLPWHASVWLTNEKDVIWYKNPVNMTAYFGWMDATNQASFKALFGSSLGCQACCASRLHTNTHRKPRHLPFQMSLKVGVGVLTAPPG